jgi:hypothetical protein
LICTSSRSCALILSVLLVAVSTLRVRKMEISDEED